MTASTHPLTIALRPGTEFTAMSAVEWEMSNAPEMAGCTLKWVSAGDPQDDFSQQRHAVRLYVPDSSPASVRAFTYLRDLLRQTPADDVEVGQ